MLPFLSNVFNDPSDPWYYVVGVIFLLLIFGAVGIYMYLVGKKKKQNPDKADSAAETDNTEKTEAADDTGKVETQTEEPTAECNDKVSDPQKQDKE